MKANLLGAVLIALIATWVVQGQMKQPSSVASQYEFKLMGLADLVKDSPAGRKKVMEIAVHAKTGWIREDLDGEDYQAAFDRLAKDGWEPVTVNKSNYWVFRRLKSHG